MQLLKTKNPCELSISNKSDIVDRFLNKKSMIYTVDAYLKNKDTNSTNTKIESDSIKISWRYSLLIDNDWTYSVQVTNEYSISEKNKQSKTDTVLSAIEETFEEMCRQLNKQKKDTSVVVCFQTPSKTSVYERNVINQFHLLCQKELDTYLIRP